MTPVRLLLVGLGNRGRMWAEIVRDHPSARLSGAVDPAAPARAAFAAAHPGVALFDDLATALAAGGHDAVLLVTPPDGHLGQAERIIAARLPLLAEKPLAEDLATAARIVAMAAAAGVPLSVGLNFRYLPVSIRLRDLLAEQVVGAPGFASMTYRRNRDGMRPGLNRYPLTMRHPMLLEQSIHHFDLIRFCYGREIERVACRTWNPAWSMYAHDSNVHCLLALQGGLEISYVGTWTGGWNQLAFEWRTDCARGIVVQRALFDDLAVAGIDDAAPVPVPLAPARPFYDDSAALLTAFIAAVAAGAAVPCDGHDHMRTLAVVEAAIASAERGVTVGLASP